MGPKPTFWLHFHGTRQNTAIYNVLTSSASETVVFAAFCNTLYTTTYSYTTTTTTTTTTRAARGGGGSFKNRKRIGKIRCCESQLSERKHSPIVQRSNSLTISELVS